MAPVLKTDAPSDHVEAAARLAVALHLQKSVVLVLDVRGFSDPRGGSGWCRVHQVESFLDGEKKGTPLESAHTERPQRQPTGVSRWCKMTCRLNMLS